MMPKAKRKAKRQREKRRARSEQAVLEAARRTGMSWHARVQSYQFNDGQLVHRVVKDNRGFCVSIPGDYPKWIRRDVWATICGRVLAVERSAFLSSRKSPNCIHCAVIPVALDLCDPFVDRAWDGSTPYAT